MTTTLLTIGMFSRMTHLSVKALRHYDDVGLLAPADVDPGSGYRLYAVAQVPTAQVIRRFRELDMPIDRIKAVITAPDPETRDHLILEHLAEMEAKLDQTQATVASLRTLLTAGASTDVEIRALPACTALTIRADVPWDDTDGWLDDVLAELDRAAGDDRAGADGALYSPAFFEEHLGDVVAFVPVTGSPRPTGRVSLADVPGGAYAVMVHEGSFAGLDAAYATLGTLVTERGIGLDGPIRENYVVTSRDSADESSFRTEVCWPVRA